MNTRALVLLFVLLALGAAGLLMRLGQLQVAGSEGWRSKAREVAYHHFPIETSRGSIVDRKGRPVAQDEPCFDLAIDYRAMTLDDRWIEGQAIKRLKAEGVTDRKERLRRLAATKAEIVGQIEGIPGAIAVACHLPLEDVKATMEGIRARIEALRQNLWSRQYDRATDAQSIAENQPTGDEDDRVKEETAYHTIVPNVATEIMYGFNKTLNRYPGLDVRPAQRRNYPYGEVGAHVIGLMRPVDMGVVKGHPFVLPNLLEGGGRDVASSAGRFAEELSGYVPGDRIGASGLERYAEGALRGVHGVKLVRLGSSEAPTERIEPVAGQSVRMTIDIEMQKDLQKEILDPARKLLKGQDYPRDETDHNIALVVLSIDGQVLAMISTPTFDLNSYDQNAVALNNDTVNRPLLNRAIAAAYPPGSTVKPLVAAGVLEKGLVGATETVVCKGHLYDNRTESYRCTGVHGAVNVDMALERSCNVFFYTMGSRLGLENITQWYAGFGFGQVTGLGLAEEGRGFLVDTRKLPAGLGDRDSQMREAILEGIGQGELNVTPLQMADAYATLLRGGVRIPPRLVVDEGRISTVPVGLSATTTGLVRKGMELVVSGSDGTARKILRMRVAIGGKTGTATYKHKVVGADGVAEMVEDNHAWFVGYVPADKPEFVIAALKEGGGHGGLTAAPLVKEAVMKLEKYGYLAGVDLP